MKEIKIYFTDFWKNFPIDNNIFTETLQKYYQVIIDPVQPDYLFFSSFGHRHYQYKNSIKIYFTGENNVPDFNLCDYGLGSSHLTFEDRYFRLPLYVLSKGFTNLFSEKNIPIQAAERIFCNFVFSNARAADPVRKEFFERLSNYKPVDSGGQYLNNIGWPVTDKLDFIKKYKFTIAFENSSLSGYTTEKLIDPMLAGSIPIYWGNPSVDQDFNTDSFVWVKNKYTIDQAIEEIIYLDSDDDAYLRKLRNQWICRPDNEWPDKLSAFLRSIMDRPLREAKRITDYGYIYYYKKHRYLTDKYTNTLIKQFIK